VGSFEQVFVQYHQFQVITGGDVGDLRLYTVGDGLVQLVGQSTLTVLTGPHTGSVGVRVATMGQPPGDLGTGWEVASEATLWCPDGRLAVCGLMGDCPDALRNAAAPGLLRVQVRARYRRSEEAASPDGPAEQYEVLAWPVHEDVGLRSLRSDDLPPTAWTPNPAQAAGWAMVRLVAKANPNPREARLYAAAARPVQQHRRVDVRRSCTLPATWAAAVVHRPADHFGIASDAADLVLPAGGVQARLSPVNAVTGPQDTFVARWRWSAAPGLTTAVPDSTASMVELSMRHHPANDTAELTLLHRGVQGPDAVLLGLVWDYLMHRAHLVAGGASVPPHPWQALFDDITAKAAQDAAAARRSRALFEAKQWAGRPPSDRLRELPANTVGLARLDRGLLDALAEATSEQQRDIARWAARRACAISGLDTVDWIADGLAAIERGQQPPPPLDDHVQTWQLLRADQQVPHTVVTIPTGTPNCSQQAAALPAIFAAARDNPLAAAVDALHAAAYAYGSDYSQLLNAAKTAFPMLDRP
jgi:hypothetical protein